MVSSILPLEPPLQMHLWYAPLPTLQTGRPAQQSRDCQECAHCGSHHGLNTAVTGSSGANVSTPGKGAGGQRYLDGAGARGGQTMHVLPLNTVTALSGFPEHQEDNSVASASHRSAAAIASGLIWLPGVGRQAPAHRVAGRSQPWRYGRRCGCALR